MLRLQNISYHLFFLLLVGLLAGSCKKSFLEIEPRGRLIPTTTAEFDLLLNNLNLLNTETRSQVIMGDDVMGVEPYFSAAVLRTQRVFRWDDVIYEPNENATEMTAVMPQIYTYNKIINEVMNSTGGTEQTKKNLLAEAKANRAWSYLLLTNYFTRPYNPLTASADPGYPIVTQADVTINTYTRPSVQDNYDFIIRDLKEAIPDLTNTPAVRARMFRGAARALLGKVYVFMGKYDLALTAFNEALADMPANIVIELMDYNVTLGPGGWVRNNNTTISGMPAGWNNTENLIVKQFSSSWTNSSNELLVGPEMLALYGSTDMRLNLFSPNAYGGTPLPAGIRRRNGPAQGQMGLMLADIYLLRAECKARLNDLPGARADLKTLREKRMPAADAEVGLTDQNDLIRFIIDERKREFPVTGYRWFDMRRLSTDPLFSGTVYKHKVLNQDNTVTEYTLRPERLTLRFPEKILLENDGMENNP